MRPKPERQALEALFLDNLRQLERIVAAVCRRHALDGADADDFASWVKLKLVEDDYAVLRKFRGESALTTYLTVVVAMLFRDYRVRHWGRWRPSAAALRQGRVAVRLETLVYRDGYRLDQAGEILRTAGETELPDRGLGTLLASLPPRGPTRPVEVGDGPLASAPAPAGADERVLSGEAEAQHRAADEALSLALARLPPEDRLIIRMRFWEGMSVADIARGLHLDQKPLYRRIERAQAQLRGSLEAAGITRDRVRSLLGDGAT
ncbi:MAG TPA: sigma-70 family RNA polymerase sigma factor [Longimicrobiaceae bacterium]|nr:sigma-70 family RNA polymerase sigma factor [Longimicrobiaceae bacterium]